MGDWADAISEGHTRTCPLGCGFVVTHIDPQVAIGIVDNHVTRNHSNPSSGDIHS